MQYMYYISLQRRRERIAAARRHRPHHRHHHHGSGQRRHTLLQHGSGDEPEGEQQTKCACFTNINRVTLRRGKIV